MTLFFNVRFFVSNQPFEPRPSEQRHEQAIDDEISRRWQTGSYTRSTTNAMPCPTPMHIVHSA